ncbi:MAG: MBL fold metallo-hydrolase [Bacteroidota bacterium]
MQLAFYGAARTVTGSKHLLSLTNGINILLDCGMFQGLGAASNELNNQFGFDPEMVHFLVLSHAHIDHSGLIPKLVKDGFKGKIFATAPTRDLAGILLEDSANIQNNGHGKKEEIDSEAFYSLDDVAATMHLFEAIEYNQPTTIAEGVTICFTEAGHLLGSAAVHFTIVEDGISKQLAFGGDTGRFRDAILCPPACFPQADYIILESTYGNKLHEATFSTTDTLMKIIMKTCIMKKGQLVIPAFSLGRTQELLYFLNQLSLEKRLPEIPVYVDSPLSYAATQIFKSYKGYFNERIQKIMQVDDDPFDFPGLQFTVSVDESIQAKNYTDPCIIIASSGMADAGRVRHHIAATVDNPANTILLVGYCSPSSLGGKLMNGAKSVSISGDEYPVNADIEVLQSMSAHGDCDDLCRFVSCQNPEQVKQIFLVHGEYEMQVGLRDRLMRKGFNNITIPALNEEITGL